MKLYHGTHTEALEAILSDGIVPRLQSRTEGTWHHLPSKPDCVYLTTAYALYYAIAAVPEGSHACPAIIEIETEGLDESLLCPDEDFIAQVLWAGKEKGQQLYPQEYDQAESLAELTSFIRGIGRFF